MSYTKNKIADHSYEQFLEAVRLQAHSVEAFLLSALSFFKQQQQ